MELGIMRGPEMPVTLVDGQFINPTIEQRLLQKKDNLERNLKEVNEALEALQANPEILKVLSLISKVNY